MKDNLKFSIHGYLKVSLSNVNFSPLIYYMLLYFNDSFFSSLYHTVKSIFFKLHDCQENCLLSLYMYVRNLI